MRRSVVLRLDCCPRVLLVSARQASSPARSRFSTALVIALCQTIRLLKHEVGTELGSLRETGSSRSRVTLAELSCGPR